MTLFTTPRRHKPSLSTSIHHRYTHTHMYLTHSGKISHIGLYEIKSRREGPRTSKIFFALLLRSPPPRTHVRFRFHSLFSSPESAAAFFSLFPRIRQAYRANAKWFKIYRADIGYGRRRKVVPPCPPPFSIGFL